MLFLQSASIDKTRRPRCIEVDDVRALREKTSWAFELVGIVNAHPSRESGGTMYASCTATRQSELLKEVT